MPAPRKVAVVRRAPARKKVIPSAKTYVKRAAPMRTVTRAKAPAKRAPAKSGGNSALGTAIGSAIGMALGGPGGGALGGMVGSAGGNFLSKIFGHGDYQVSNSSVIKDNNLIGNSANIPQFGTGKVASKFRHREFLGDVFSAATANTFKIDSYPINPGLDRTFPWLAGVVGAKFQQYRINGMTFEFRSMSADALNSVNTSLGSVIMSTDYDSADTTFTSKQEMENTEYGVSCKPSVNMMHAIECARSQTPVSELYIRAFDVPSGKDIRFYDMGRFSIASTGCQGTNVNLGELWVSYDIDAFKAIEQAPNYLTGVAQYKLNAVDATHALGTSQTQVIDQIGLTITYIAGVARVVFPYDMPPGTIFSFFWSLQGTTTALVPIGDVTSETGGLATWQGYSAQPYPGPTGTSDAKTFYSTYRYNGSGTPALPPSFAVVGGVVPSAITNAAFTVSMMSGLTPQDGFA